MSQLERQSEFSNHMIHTHILYIYIVIIYIGYRYYVHVFTFLHRSLGSERAKHATKWHRSGTGTDWRDWHGWPFMKSTSRLHVQLRMKDDSYGYCTHVPWSAWEDEKMQLLQPLHRHMMQTGTNPGGKNREITFRFVLLADSTTNSFKVLSFLAPGAMLWQLLLVGAAATAPTAARLTSPLNRMVKI